MSNGNAYERLWKLCTKAFMLVLDGKRKAEELSELLQRFISEQKLNPAVFIGPGWKYGKSRDERSAALGAVIDYTKGKLLNDWLRSGQASVRGDERRQRILADQSVVALNCDHFLHYWNNPSEIPEEWKPYIITFDGDELLNPDGSRCVLFLCWGGAQWYWDSGWLDSEDDARHRAAVLAV